MEMEVKPEKAKHGLPLSGNQVVLIPGLPFLAASTALRCPPDLAPSLFVSSLGLAAPVGARMGNSGGSEAEAGGLLLRQTTGLVQSS